MSILHMSGVFIKTLFSLHLSCKLFIGCFKSVLIQTQKMKKLRRCNEVGLNDVGRKWL